MSAPTAFEWDDAKASANEAKHGVSFEIAIEVFRDGRQRVAADKRFDYGEERFTAIGAVGGLCLAVVFTMRGDVARIISARRANRRERRLYEGGT
ncbi:BrnT family toxin [Salinarimonas rosea]|uniref:BrnT family toxin n=1 Tax=Salinarimonas rosea TaxID=552063 RepID=UPI0003FBC499|nr:BrnT family toxin [Salinarimonas rosea]